MAKKASRKKSTAKKAVRKKASPKSGKRYSAQEKAEIVQFVWDHDKAHGRGGRSAAVKKYGVSQLTVAKWLKGTVIRKSKTVAPTQEASVVSTATVKPTSTLDNLNRMAAIQEQIEALQGEYEGLKGVL
jgi:transposase-like protein